MNVMSAVHPYLDGKPKRMLIGGKWLEAASGRTFETRNPATGELLANIAEGDAEDIERAVAAARAAFNGPWRRFKPAERQRLLLKLADLVERDIEEFAALDTLDMGAPISRTRNNRQRALGMLRFYAGMATALVHRIEEVIERGNQTQFGLGSGVCTRDVGKAHRLAKSIRAGSVWINCYQAMDPAVPFGGYKMSGYGRESGVQHLEEYLNVKSVWIKTD